MVEKTTMLGVDMTGWDKDRIVTFALDNISSRKLQLVQQNALPLYMQLRDLIFGATALTLPNAPTLADLRARVDADQLAAWDGTLQIASLLKAMIIASNVYKPMIRNGVSTPHPMLAGIMADPVPMPAA